MGLESPEIKAQFEARARIMKAMAHPTRLFIIEELSRGERCVADITHLVDADISTVSKHLAVLRNAGLVADEKRGTSIYYQLRVPCVMEFMGCVEAVLEANAEDHARIYRMCCKGGGLTR